jgi:hypothetical protein
MDDLECLREIFHSARAILYQFKDAGTPAARILRVLLFQGRGDMIVCGLIKCMMRPMAYSFSLLGHSAFIHAN